MVADMSSNTKKLNMEYLEAVRALTFEQFLEKKGISPTDDRVPLLREVWNQGVDSACLYFGNHEGTDFGAHKALTVK